MTKEEIIRMAREAGFTSGEIAWHDEMFERFAALVYAEAHQHGLDDFEATVLPVAIAAEREACAKVCYELPWKDMDCIPSNLAFAAAIRARGNT